MRPLKLPDENESTDTDELLSRLGNPGRFQILLFLLLSFQYFPVAMNDLMPLFYSIPPTEVVCKDKLNLTSTTASHDKLNSTLIPTNLTDLCAVPCKSGYVYRYPDWQWSIVADMDLICDRAPLVYVASAIYFLGSLLGGLFWGELADKFGRRKILLLTNVLYTIFSSGTIFSRDYISFVLLRFCTGFAVQGMAGTFYIIIMEWIPTNRRGIFATMCQFFFTIANICLAIIANFLQNWRYIQILLAVSNAAAVTYFWFAPEPLQWLLLNNQVESARIMWKRIAQFNRVDLNDEDLKQLEFLKYKTPTQSHSMLDCFRTPQIRRKTLLACYAWFATFICYMGMSFVITDIAPNLYHNLIISGVLELIPCLLAAVLVAKYGPKHPLLSYFISGGLLAIIVSAIPTWSYTANMAKNVLAILCRMCLLGCMSTVTFFTVELFPTVIRNSAYGLCAAAMHIGGMASHEIFFLVLPNFTGIPAIILGVIALLGGLATSLLPQTDGKLPETIEEAEAILMERIETPAFLRRRKSPATMSVEPATFSS